jgi:proline iminopeptidase
MKMPMLIIAGRFDRVALPRFSIKFKQYAPKAEFVMFEKSGHQPFVEEPDKYFKVLIDFLDSR